MGGTAGCASLSLQNPPTAPTPLPAARKRALETARYRSLGDALGKIDSKTVRSWINRWSAPGGVSSANQPRDVRIDAETLAHLHPAWALANQLEVGAVAATAPQIQSVLKVAVPAVSLAREPGAAVPERVLPPLTVRQGFSPGAARVQQSAASQRFFAAAAARDAALGNDEVSLARRALEDSIIAAQKGAVAELDLSLVPPEVALELTNLRLRLLRNLSRTADQRAATREEIQAIEDRYAQIWNEQTALQAARLREATRDLPIRQRQQGLEKIAEESQTRAAERFAARQVTASEAQSQIRRDFAAPSPGLRLELPPARAVGSVVARFEKPDQFSGTMTQEATSKGQRGGGSLQNGGRFDAKIVASLRAKARVDSRQWARLLAAQLGSHWSESRLAPDRTREAIAILFPRKLG